jgi:hypothetical protein
MANAINLPPNHKRVLSAAARSIENSLNDIELRVLSGTKATPILRHIEKSYSDYERKVKQKKVAQLRSALIEFVREFALEEEHLSEKQIFDANVSHIWTLLEDAYSDKMRNYGELPKDTKEPLDRAVSDLLFHLEDLKNT